MVSNNWYWFDDLKEKGWDALPSFDEEERIPRIKEFVTKLFLNKEWGSYKADQQIKKYYKKLDQIYRNEFENFEVMTNTLRKDMDFLLSNKNKDNMVGHLSELYHNPKYKYEQKELVIQKAVIRTIKSLHTNNHKSQNAKLRQKEIKEERKIIKSLKFPCIIKLAKKKYKFENKNEFNQKINYWTNPILSSEPLNDRLKKYPNLINDFEGVIKK